MQQSFFQTETLSVLLNSAASHLGIPASELQHLADRLSDEDAAKLNGELVDLLRDLPPTDIDFEEELPPPGGDTSKLSSRIWRQAKKDGQPTKMMFIRVKDAAPTVGIALVGLVIALVTLSPSVITSAMS